MLALIPGRTSSEECRSRAEYLPLGTCRTYIQTVAIIILGLFNIIMAALLITLFALLSVAATLPTEGELL